VAYSTSAHVKTAVGGEANLVALSDHAGAGVVNETVVAEAIAEADAIINSYASKRFAVPFANPPATIVNLSARMAARALRRNKPGSTTIADTKDDEADIRWLEALSRGEVAPGVEPAPERSELVIDTVGDRESIRLTTREKLKGSIW
jgi:phage gp36-like protein